MVVQVCDCLPTREGTGYFLCYQVTDVLLLSSSNFSMFSVLSEGL